MDNKLTEKCKNVQLMPWILLENKFKKPALHNIIIKFQFVSCIFNFVFVLNAIIHMKLFFVGRCNKMIPQSHKPCQESIFLIRIKLEKNDSSPYYFIITHKCKFMLTF